MARAKHDRALKPASKPRPKSRPRPSGGGSRLLQGNEAMALGALAAGCDFFAGYPITPASEITEYMSRELPARGAPFIQMFECKRF